MNERFLSFFSAAAITMTAGALYIPFIGNPMVFDDLYFFSSGTFAHIATHPVDVALRGLPYFTLAFPQVLWGQFPPWHHAEIHRVISLGFHIACGLALFVLIRDLLRMASSSRHGDPIADRSEKRGVLPAFIGATLFLIHPVAVYGAAYLVQRTILMATLFSLLSILAFVHGIVRRSYLHALFASLFYTVAVFSKEHALVLPAAAILIAPVLTRDAKFTGRFASLYLAACIPAAVTVFLLVRGVIGIGYEPAFDALLSQIEGIPVIDAKHGPWLVSVVTQTGLFFKYLALWLVPDVRAMSVDLRIDFARTWSIAWISLELFAFLGFGLLSLVLLTRRGRYGLIGFGLAYSWILFAVELTTVRFQEPFVLYRSYLWAPGLMIVVTTIASALPRKALVILFIAVCPVLLYQAHDRLQTFTSNLALWQDAADKLPGTPVPFGSRVLFGLAREQVYAGQLDKAEYVVDRCMAQYPKSWQCNFSRGALDIQGGRYLQAVSYLNRAAAIDPQMAVIHVQRGLALERLGRMDEAREAYRKAASLGFIVGEYRLDLLDNPDAAGPRLIYDASRVGRYTK